MIWIPAGTFDSSLMLFHLIYLRKKYRTHEYSELFPERLHSLAGDPFTFLPHGTPSAPPPLPAMDFLGEIRRGTQGPSTFLHGEFDSNKGRAKDLLTFHACLLIFLNHAEVWLAAFLSSGAVGWLALALVRRRTEKSSGKVQDVTEN